MVPESATLETDRSEVTIYSRTSACNQITVRALVTPQTKEASRGDDMHAIHGHRARAHHARIIIMREHQTLSSALDNLFSQAKYYLILLIML